VSGDRIRASQGHSVEVDLGLSPAPPPATLFHGTVERFLASIRREGLVPGARTHVHLSADVETARRVGQRRGAPVVLVVDAAAMAAAGLTFRRSENGVWLTDRVPPEYLTFPP
jgi:putative RNA 2'-phosphotransferase